MINHSNNSMYTPYGAYELKAFYQRNMLIGMTVALSLVLVLVGVHHLQALLAGDAPAVVKPDVEPGVIIVSDWTAPPTIIYDEAIVVRETPLADIPQYAVPVPIPDEEAPDGLDVMLPTIQERRAIVEGPPAAPGEVFDYGLLSATDEEHFPSPDSVFFVEKQAFMIREVQPEYPLLARRAGLEGEVWVQALVGVYGDVMKARVKKSSEITSLDDAAVTAAYKNKYKPAVQNGRPVPVWVTYQVKFVLR